MEREFTLEKLSELRIEVDAKQETTLKLLSGKAEVFGTELAAGQSFVCSGMKIALFTWHGCRVQMTGPCLVAYTWSSTPMASYLNAHTSLEARRQAATVQPGLAGPVVLVLGPPSSGKSTLSRTLCSYAARLGRRPLLVDLDMAEGSTSWPGMLSIVLVDKPVDVTTGFSDYNPLVFHYGHMHPGDNEVLFRHLATQMAAVVARRFEQNAASRTSGVVINTYGVNKELALFLRDAFKVDTILILDSDRLYYELQSAPPAPHGPVHVLELAKSGGVVARDEGQRERARLAETRRYFYGPPAFELRPHAFEVPFDRVRVFKIGAPALPASCLPLGAERPETETQLVPVQPNQELIHKLLSVSSVPADWELSKDGGTLVKSSVLGCVCVQNVDMQRRNITVLSPAPYPLPRTILIVSQALYVDT